MNPFYKNLSLWIVIIVLILMLVNIFGQNQVTESKLNYSEFLSMVESGRIDKVIIQNQELFITDISGNKQKVFAPKDTDLVNILREKGVSIEAKPPAESSWFVSILASWLPMIVLVGIWIFFMRQMQGGGGKAMSFGKSRARLLSDNSTKVTFADVAGIEEDVS